MGSVIHIGFMTIALFFIVILIIVSFASPPIFEGILDAISGIAKAVRGEPMFALT